MKKLLVIGLVLCVVVPSLWSASQAEDQTAGATPTVTYYRGSPGVVKTIVSDWGDSPFWQEYQKRVGINVEFIQIPQDGANHLSMLIASGDYPDMIENFWGRRYPGGPAQAIEDGVILPLNDVFQEFAPNVTRRIAEMKQLGPGNLLAMQTGNGDFFGFPMLRFDDDALVFYGPQLRADWLAGVGMDIPETIDDWSTLR